MKLPISQSMTVAWSVPVDSCCHFCCTYWHLREDQENQFEGSVHCTAQLSFPHHLLLLSLLQFYGACLKTESTVLVVEYMPGGDLMEALAEDRRGELRWMRRGHNIALDLARALVYLHKNKVSWLARILGAAPRRAQRFWVCLPA